MKIALCLEYPIDQTGGTEVLVRELIKGLSLNHQIVLVSPDDSEALARSSVASCVSEHIQWKPTDQKVADARNLADQICLHKVDLAHFHFGGNYAWSNRAYSQCPVVHVSRQGIPCISTNHGAFSIMEGYCWHIRPLWIKLALFLPAWLSKQLVLAHVKTEVAVSKHDCDALRRWYWPMKKKFRYIYHSQLVAPPPPFNSNRKKVILCAGTFGYRKGQPYLVEAFCQLGKKFPDWKLVFIGRYDEDDPSMDHIRALIVSKELGSQIEFLGRRSDEELTDWMRQSAIFAMPSVFEGLGLSLQEAQFNGCACVASAAGGVVDLLQDDDNGLLVPVKDVQRLTEALEKLMSDEALRNRLSKRAPISVIEKEMTALQMVSAYEQLYLELSGTSGPK